MPGLTATSILMGACAVTREYMKYPTKRIKATPPIVTPIMMFLVEAPSSPPFLTCGGLLVGWLVGEARPPAPTVVVVKVVNLRDDALMDAFLKAAPPLDWMDLVKLPLVTLAVIDFVYWEYNESGWIV